MKNNLTLESGLEVDFTPDFDMPNEAQIDKVTWTLPDPINTKTVQLLDPEYFLIGKDETNETQFISYWLTSSESSSYSRTSKCRVLPNTITFRTTTISSRQCNYYTARSGFCRSYYRNTVPVDLPNR